ncbi:MAG: oxygen-independent coproporphyrinogen III oxidase [Rhodobacteraceae bacterium]|nr:oxygen-independent coproporphyrinogen III oxidase [Paracoccaceae bacterium]
MTTDAKSQLSRMGLFDSRVPRYTSYPTAPHFRSQVGATQMSDWLRAIPAGAAISLYVHVPFCRRLCWFCACRTQGTRNLDTVRAYLEHLKNEIALLRAALPQGVHLSRIHWGGGTPTLMDPAMIADLAQSIATLGPVTEDSEFSVEIDPNEIDDARLDALVAAGMTRASIGVQDFDEAIQQSIGRIQSYDVTRDMAEAIRARGITSLNADILYGLPMQTRARITDSVQRLLSLSPDRVALYGYAHVPWMSRRQSMIPSDKLPTPEERLELFETARKLFLWDGYSEIGIDHFARKGDSMETAARTRQMRRNFQGYTDDRAEVLIGLGASSISRFPQGYAQNQSGTRDYSTAIQEGRFATARGYCFEGEDLLRARIIEALMCDFRVDAQELLRDFAVTPARLSELFGKAAVAFPGFADVTPLGFAIRPEGRPLTRMIARAFDGFDLAASGHSSAV